MFNQFLLEGRVGRVGEGKNHAFVNICHVKFWFDKKLGEQKQEESWFKIIFFKDQAKALLKHVQVGDRLFCIGDFNQYPKVGPDTRTVMQGHSFRVLRKYYDIRKDTKEEDQGEGNIEEGTSS